MRRCKNKCGKELPPAAKCEDYTQKEGYCSSDCKREHQKDKKAKAKPKSGKPRKRSGGVKRSPADIAFSDCVRYAAGYTCQKCGKVDGQMECSHIFSRKNRTIRWAKDNAMCKCHTCHRWWHENPTESGDWFRNLVGEGAYQILVEKKNSKQRVSKLEEEEIAKHYREQLRKMQSGDQDDFDSWQ